MRWRRRSGQNGFAVIRWTKSWSLIGREQVTFTRSWEITKPLFTWTLVVILFWQMINNWFAPRDFIKCSNFWINVAYLFICFFYCTRCILFNYFGLFVCLPLLVDITISQTSWILHFNHQPQELVYWVWESLVSMNDLSFLLFYCILCTFEVMSFK